MYHHSHHPNLNSIFEIWNSLFPHDPIIKKKKTREERMRENLHGKKDKDDPESKSPMLKKSR